MNELELRIRVQNTLEETIDSITKQGVSFTLVEDALYKMLFMVKDKAYQELLISVSAPAPTENTLEEENADARRDSTES